MRTLILHVFRVDDRCRNRWFDPMRCPPFATGRLTDGLVLGRHKHVVLGFADLVSALRPGSAIAPHLRIVATFPWLLGEGDANPDVLGTHRRMPGNECGTRDLMRPFGEPEEKLVLHRPFRHEPTVGAHGGIGVAVVVPVAIAVPVAPDIDPQIGPRLHNGNDVLDGGPLALGHLDRLHQTIIRRILVGQIVRSDRCCSVRPYPARSRLRPREKRCFRGKPPRAGSCGPAR